MCKAVTLAAEARARFLRELKDTGHGQARDIKISLSLGPYGATLSPAQEFDGFYPPPFGPKAYSTPSGHNTNAFDVSNKPAEARRFAIASLETFHLERLAIFSESPSVWDTIDFIAFETVPLTTEIIAIRKAMGRLYATFPALHAKPWWISTVWPNGQFPEEAMTDGQRLSVREVTLALYGSQEDVEETHDAIGVPAGIGINCTNIDAIENILPEMSTTILEVQRACGQPAPFLVVYPNRGDVYDVVKQTWAASDNVGGGGGGDSWGMRLCEIVRRSLKEEESAWRGSIVGGCCKVGPADIAGLVEAVKAIYAG